jgi:hypothetical protein
MSEDHKSWAEKEGIDPTTDSTFLSLKNIATRRGSLYTRGILDVLNQIEQRGYFTHCKMAGLICLLSLPSSRILNKDEIAEAEGFLDSRGWSREQGKEYAAGLADAENRLSHFKRPE